MKGALDAVGFLTRVPVGARPASAPEMAAAVPWFPVVGAALGVGQAGLYVAALEVVPPLAAAALAVAAQLLLTGAFHEDGLADMADAAGGTTREERLAIIRDPFHGTYGVLALVASYVVRVAALSALGGGQALAALPAAHAGGRGAAVLLMGRMAPAQGEGLGAGYLAGLTGAQAACGVVIAAAVVVTGLRPWALPALGLAAGLALVMGRYARRTLGGLTGDALGATEQVAEAAILLTAVAAV